VGPVCLDLPVLSMVGPAKTQVDKGKAHLAVCLQYSLIPRQTFLDMLQTAHTNL